MGEGRGRGRKDPGLLRMANFMWSHIRRSVENGMANEKSSREGEGGTRIHIKGLDKRMGGVWQVGEELASIFLIVQTGGPGEEGSPG